MQMWKIEAGSLVCAKMATFWAWPAQIIRFDNKKAYVKFFGDLRRGCIEKTQCVPYHLCQTVIFNYIQSMDQKKVDEWEKKLDYELDEGNRNQIIKHMSIRMLFLQATKDIELFAQTFFKN